MSELPILFISNNKARIFGIVELSEDMKQEKRFVSFTLFFVVDLLLFSPSMKFDG